MAGPSAVGGSRAVAADGFAVASPTTLETTMTSETKSTQTERIRDLNDEVRRNLSEATAVMTCGVAALGPEAVARIVQTIEVYDDFCHANDPYEKHDFGSFVADGHTIFWLIGRNKEVIASTTAQKTLGYHQERNEIRGRSV